MARTMPTNLSPIDVYQTGSGDRPCGHFERCITDAASISSLLSGYFVVGQSGNPTLTGANAYGIRVDMQDLGSGINEHSCLLLTKSNTNQAAVDTYISCKEFGTSVRVTSLLRWRGSDAPTYWFEISGAAQGGCWTSRASAYTTILGTIKVFIEADANKAGYINVYSAA